MIRRTWIARLFAAAVAAVAFTGSSAQAGIIPVSVTITPDAGNYRWTYAIVLPTDMKLQAGNYFTIYDFGGLVSTDSIVTPTGWTAVVSKSSVAPTGLKPTDNPDIENLTFIYDGPTIPSGQVGLGNFWAISTESDQNAVSTHFTAENQQFSTGNTDRNIVDTIAPGIPTITPPTPGVPEPTTLALAGLGLPLVGAARLIRRRKK
jgi:hypothetical protein